MMKNGKLLGTQIAAAAALVLAVFAAPSMARAQSGDAKDIIQLITGEGSVKLQTSSDSFCTASSADHAIAVAVGGRCSSFATSVDLPADLYVRIAGDQLTFRDGRQSYVIRDASLITSARALFAPVRDMMQGESDLGHRMSDLGARERATVPQYLPAKVTIPDLSADFEKVEADAKRLSAEGGTQSELSNLQSELSELQSRVAELQSQASEEKSRLEEQRSGLDSQMQAMGKEMEAMSQQMSAWSRQGEEAAVQAAQRVKELLDRAIANGTAKPE